MSETGPRSAATDDRRPLDPGTRIGGSLLVLKPIGAGPAALLYEGLRLADQTGVRIVECCPVGLAVRSGDGDLAALRGWEAEFAQSLDRFTERALTLGRFASAPIEAIGEPFDAFGTRYLAAPDDGRVPLDAWITELLRRPSADDIATLASRIGSALSALHAAGLGHGGVSGRSIRLTQPEDAILAEAMLGQGGVELAETDMRGLASALYGLVTGRAAPQPGRDRTLDLALRAGHIAAGDYPEGLLAAIDAGLGLDGAEQAPRAADWLSAFGPAPMAAAPPTAAQAREASIPPRPEAAPPAGKPATSAAKPVDGAGTPQRRLTWPALAATALVLAGAAGWLGYQLLSGTPGPPPQRTASDSRLALPQAEPSPPPAKAAPPETAPTPAAAPPVPAPPANPAIVGLNAEVDAAVDRATLEELAQRGADPARIAERFVALGFVALPAGSETAFRQPGDGRSLRDCADCPELVLVPSGRVSMQLTIANTPRDIALDIPRPLLVGRTEVTRAQFARFVSESGRVIAPGCHTRSPSWRLDPALSWREPGFVQGDSDPAICISYEDAVAYTGWLSAKTGRTYRLPTDAEWHYLAAGEDWDRREADVLCAIGNGADRSALEIHPQWSAAACSDGFVHTAPVGLFAPSRWGLHDLSGNAWEWVSTCAPEPLPDAPFPPASCAPSAPRILRGGSFADPPQMRLLDARIVSAPAIRDQVAGFRVVRD